MAEEKPKSEHRDGKKKKPKLHKIITTRAKDGSFGHEHIHEGSNEPVFAGTSRDMSDLHQHFDDHFGPGGGEPAEEAGETPPAGSPPGGEVEPA
jgi:hypothetical protein